MVTLCLVRSLVLGATLAGLAGCQTPTAPTEPPGPRLVMQRYVERLQLNGSLDLEDPDWRARLPPPPGTSFDERRDYSWVVNTSLGSFTVRLFSDVAPRHVANIVYMSELGYYEGLYFHHVESELMVYGGGLRPDRESDPGTVYTVGETPLKEVGFDRPGRVAMVRRDGGSLGGRFLVTLEETTWLDGDHAVIGQVVEGLDTVRRLGRSVEQGEPEAARIDSTRILVTPSTLEQVRLHIARLSGMGLLDRSREDWRSVLLPDPPRLKPAVGKSFTWHIETSEGPMEVLLFAEEAPRHVVNVLYLSELGYYDGLFFHRVIPGFMAQGGGMAWKRGGAAPGYAFLQERSVSHDRPYRVAMVADSVWLSVGGQFFVTYAATPWLDELNTVFGQVVAGSRTLRRIETYGSPSGATSRPVTIVSTRVDESNAGSRSLLEGPGGELP